MEALKHKEIYSNKYEKLEHLGTNLEEVIDCTKRNLQILPLHVPIQSY